MMGDAQKIDGFTAPTVVLKHYFYLNNNSVYFFVLGDEYGLFAGQSVDDSY